MLNLWDQIPYNKIGELGDRSGRTSYTPSLHDSVPDWDAVTEIPTPAISVPVLHLLVVDEDAPVRSACCEIARKMGFAVTAAESLPAARAILQHQKVDLILLDLKSPGGSALSLLEEVKAIHPETNVVVMTAYATVSSAVEAMRIGAGDYLTKPFAVEELATILGRAGDRRQFNLESRRLRDRLRSQGGVAPLIGRSPQMEKLYRILSKVAHSNNPVIILGESGTGKEAVARSIHFNGPNAAKPFVPVDCGSLVPALVEGELFGYVKGAFPGAMRTKEGLLSVAAGGTVFLDEVADLPLDLQGKLLRALQQKEIRPMGSSQAVPISARILAATNRDLSAMVDQGRFRRDLYFRLNVVSLKIPPLRDHREDIPMLVTHFLERQQKETGTAHSFSDEALRVISEYEWPGNVRELEAAIQSACALSSGPVLHTGDLPAELQEFRLESGRNRPARIGEGSGAAQSSIQERAFPQEDSSSLGNGYGAGLSGGREAAGIISIAELEKKAILGTIRQLNGDKLMAARLLGIGKTTLYRKLKEYGFADVH